MRCFVLSPLSVRCPTGHRVVLLTDTSQREKEGKREGHRESDREGVTVREGERVKESGGGGRENERFLTFPAFNQVLLTEEGEEARRGEGEQGTDLGCLRSSVRPFHHLLFPCCCDGACLLSRVSPRKAVGG